MLKTQCKARLRYGMIRLVGIYLLLSDPEVSLLPTKLKRVGLVVMLILVSVFATALLLSWLELGP